MRYSQTALLLSVLLVAGCATLTSSSVDQFFDGDAVQTVTPRERAEEFGVQWGSTRQEVHLSEAGQLAIWDATGTWYQDEADGQMYMRRYAFQDGGMVAITQYPTANLQDVNSIEGMLGAAGERDALTKKQMQALGRPDIVDSHPELRVEHYGWNGDGVYAIAQVDKDDGGATIWYGHGQLTESERAPGELRGKYRSLSGDDLYGRDKEQSMPNDLRENPSMTARDRLVATEDEMEGQTIYRDPSTGRRDRDNELMLYIVDQEGELPRLILKKSYSAKNWLFINRVNALADGQRYEIQSVEHQTNRETTLGGIRETFRAEVVGETEEMVRALAHADDATIRLTGKSSYRDIEVSPREKRAMRNVLAFYDEMALSTSY